MELVINSKGKDIVVIYDEEDSNLVLKYHWFLSHGYPVRNSFNIDGVRTKQLLHREIMGLRDPNIKCDHKNRNKLDARRVNLRVATPSQNHMNRDTWNKNGYKGVALILRKPTHSIRYSSRLQINNKMVLLGIFKSKTAAAIAYDAAAESHFGEFANFNFN